MFLTRSEYDRGVNTFSPEGRLFQVEYAMEAVKLGSTAVGIRTNEGVVLAVEKRLTSPLIEPSSVEKIMEIDSFAGAAMSGLTADARTLIDRARLEAQQHVFTYNESMKVSSIAQCISDATNGFGKGEDTPSRPFGVSLLLAGVDAQGGPQLYHTDPYGSYTQWEAKAIGSGSEGAQNVLKEEYNVALSLQEALVLALKILKQVMEEKVDEKNVEVATVTAADGYRLCDNASIMAIIEKLSEQQ